MQISLILPTYQKNDMEEALHIKIKEYDYPLPEARIAKYPLPERSESKLLVYRSGHIEETVFKNISGYISPDDMLVFNNTRVIQARMHFKKETGASIEIFGLEPDCPKEYSENFAAVSSCKWICMIGNLKKWKEGRLHCDFNVKGRNITLWAEREQAYDTGHIINFQWGCDDVTFAEILDSAGELPIPPYLNRATEESDKKTYQTVYSKIDGSVAAPTAGLHFTEKVLDDIRKKGTKCAEITLHVGAGTFKPVKSEDICNHEMHTEYIAVKRETIEQLVQNKGRIIAVGTTSVRTLESLYYMGLTTIDSPDATEEQLKVAQWRPYSGTDETSTEEALNSLIGYMHRHNIETLYSSTQIIIAPGYKYRVVDALITNFHQPKSTLLLLVSAFLGDDSKWKDIYSYALSHDFRFLSYGDSSLLMP